MRLIDLFEMRTDSEEFSNLDYANQWLAKYTYENLDKWPSKDIVQTLLSRYSNDADLTIYRGMNFRTKDGYDEFVASIEDGRITTHGISSWARTREGSRQFAIVQPTYFPDRETFAQEKLAREQGEELRGYRGVILKTTIKAGEGIDVSKSRLGHEDEIILPAGTYPVEIETIRPYGEQFSSGERSVSTFVQGLTDMNFEDKEHGAIWNHILAQRVHELTPADQTHIFNMVKDRGSKMDFHIREIMDWLDKIKALDYDKEIDFLFSGTFYRYERLGIFGDHHDAEIQQIAKKAWERFLKIAREHPNAYLRAPGIGHVAKLAGQETQFMRFMKERVGKKYNELNSRAVTSTVKSQNDIYTMTKRIENLMRQYSELTA